DGADGQVGHVPPVVAASAGTAAGRPAQRALAPSEPLPRRGRDRARSPPRCRRVADARDRRAGGLSRSLQRGGQIELSQQLRLDGQHGRRSLSARHVTLLQNDRSASQPPPPLFSPLHPPPPPPPNPP